MLEGCNYAIMLPMSPAWLFGQTLQDLCSQNQARFTEAEARYNRKKNRFPDKLPCECTIHRCLSYLYNVSSGILFDSKTNEFLSFSLPPSFPPLPLSLSLFLSVFVSHLQLDDASCVRLRSTPQPGSSYINASFVNVSTACISFTA